MLPRPSRSGLLRLTTYATAFVVVGLALWVDNTFGAPSIDQILYHLQYSEGAALRMGEIFVMTFVAEVLAFPLAFALLATWLHGMLAGQWPGATRRVLGALPAVALGASVLALLHQFSAFSYAAVRLGPDHFATEYVDPRAVAMRPGTPRNLVLIYAESLEQTYGEPAIFGRDLLAPLHALGGQRFASYRQAPGANWTIAGMVATQCGVPLKAYSEYDIKREDGQRVFLPGATCLGDVLRERGYRNVFLGGAPLSFAGKGSFLNDHGYDEAYGREEWERAGARPEEMNEWGLYDSALLERARTRLQELRAAGQPFNLTLLTLDTHNPHGFLSPECRRRGARDFEGIVACNSEQLAEFVQYISDQGWLADTAVVVMGDHLAVPNPAYDKLEREPERRIFNLLLAQPQPPRNTEDLLPYDFFPTLVELAGLQVEGNRLGLGWSAIHEAQAGRPAAREPLSLAALHGSARYRALWDPED